MTIAQNPAGGAGSDNPQNPAGGAGSDNPQNPAGGKPAGSDDLTALRAKVAELEADKAARDKAAGEAAAKAEQERQAGLTEAQRQQEEISALKAAQAADKAELRKTKLDAAAERLGVKANYRQYLPDVDPADAAGQAQLERWAQEHPEALQARGAEPLSTQPTLTNKLLDIVAGKASSPLVTNGLLKKFGVK